VRNHGNVARTGKRKVRSFSNCITSDGEAVDEHEGGHLVFPRLLEGAEAGKARFGVVDVTMRGDSTSLCTT
jgi:hypothetical protein